MLTPSSATVRRCLKARPAGDLPGAVAGTDPLFRDIERDAERINARDQ
jgi:hypothetical protein